MSSRASCTCRASPQRWIKKFPDDQILKEALKDFYKEEDGDQSPLRGIYPGSPAQNMRGFESAQGMMMGTPQMFMSLPNDAIRAAWVGQFDEFKKLFDPVKYSNLRSYKLNLPITTLLVAGTQRLVRSGAGKDGQFEEILKLVLENGWFRVDSKDIAGYTALEHAAGHHPQLSLAKILIDHGADPSSKNRMGGTTLFTAVMGQDIEAIQLLLDAGSDTQTVDYEGGSVSKIALSTNPKIIAMFDRATNRNQELKNIVPGGCCNNPSCGKPGAMKRCSECRVAIYCNRDCARQAWKLHKKVCKKVSTDEKGEGDDGLLHNKIHAAKLPKSTIRPTDISDVISRAWGVKDGGTMTTEELKARAVPLPKSSAKADKDASMALKVELNSILTRKNHEVLIFNK